jgi:pimeloyl-ACP methyl ester carboxylesterase
MDVVGSVLTPGGDVRSAQGLEYTIRGRGEPVLLIHGSHVADAFLPLEGEPALADRYRLVRYHRRGLGKSACHKGSFSVEEQGQDGLRLADELGLERFHLVGHSYGGVTALQLALDAPERVHSLVLLEPPLWTAKQVAEQIAAFDGILELYASGEVLGAVDAFMAVVGGPDWREALEAKLPGAAAQAERDATSFFEVEVPALAAWSFDAGKASRLQQPVAFLIGSESGALFEGPRDLFLSLVPRAEEVVLPGLNHLLQIQDSGLVARAIADFLGRHPL